MDFTLQDIVTSGLVALVGPPNSGKSTLLNTLLGQKVSIVSPRPQTTRNRIAGILNKPDFQIVFLDTPGLHKSRIPLNQEMVRIAMESLQEVDAVVFIIDISQPYTDSIKNNQQQEYSSYFRQVRCPAILLLNKIDLVDRSILLPIIKNYAEIFPFKAIIPISAMKGDGIDTLIEELLKVLPQGFRYFPEDMPTDATERFLAAEIIREKVFLQTGQEIPYSSAVLIDSFKENDEAGSVTIHATIFVERSSQKGIIIGKGGGKLKSIGSAARREIMKMLGRKVELNIWVKVKKRWSQDSKFLRELGFS